MRKRFEQQLRIGQISIHDADIDLKSRDYYVALMRALKEIFTTPEYNKEVFRVLEEKGKLHPNVELGKKVAITTDQFNLIVDYRIMEHESDSEIVIPLADKILRLFPVHSWTFDKGFYNKESKELLKLL